MDLDVRQRELPYKPLHKWTHFAMAFFLCGFVYWVVVCIAMDIFFGPYIGGTAEANEMVLRVLRTAPIFGGIAAPIWYLIVRRYRQYVIANLPDDRYFDGKPEDYWDWPDDDYDAWRYSDAYNEWADWDEYDEYAQ